MLSFHYQLFLVTLKATLWTYLLPCCQATSPPSTFSCLSPWLPKPFHSLPSGPTHSIQWLSPMSPPGRGYQPPPSPVIQSSTHKGH